MARIEPEFRKRNTQRIRLSVGPVASHLKWEADIEAAKKLFPEGWKSPRPYLRIVKSPV